MLQLQPSIHDSAACWCPVDLFWSGSSAQENLRGKQKDVPIPQAQREFENLMDFKFECLNTAYIILFWSSYLAGSFSLEVM